jgi:hypothetical protein
VTPGALSWVIAGGAARVDVPASSDRPAVARALVDRLRQQLDPGRSDVRDASSFDVAVAASTLQGTDRTDCRTDSGRAHVAGRTGWADQPVAAPRPGDGRARTRCSPRDRRWLLERYATVTWPSEASLVAVRSSRARGGLSRSFIGFGDPVFAERLAALAPLPETERELHALATAVRWCAGKTCSCAIERPRRY